MNCPGRRGAVPPRTPKKESKESNREALRQGDVLTPLPAPAYTTAWGRAYLGDARQVLRGLPDESVDLVFTSPPFALRRQKAYGNPSAEEYADWFWPFAVEIHRVLRPQGSFVYELAGAWEPGQPVRSLFPYGLLLRLTAKGSALFYLAQEFYWYNPSRLPTPAEYVTIRRCRVKDAVSVLWWLSKSPQPQADNRQVLRPYSPSMQRLLRQGYRPARRPSQHDISPYFRRDNGGAIPPNLLIVPNTRSQDEYLRRCRQAGLPIHPARFPPELPEFFIRFLTRPEQVVLDPFAGSNVTGWVAESLGRYWISIELRADYVAGSRLRFDQTGTDAPPARAAG
jgi:DNA modification methylase